MTGEISPRNVAGFFIMNNIEEATEDAGKLRNALYELVKQYEEKYPGVYIESFQRMTIENNSGCGTYRLLGPFTITANLNINS